MYKIVKSNPPADSKFHMYKCTYFYGDEAKPVWYEVRTLADTKFGFGSWGSGSNELVAGFHTVGEALKRYPDSLFTVDIAMDLATERSEEIRISELRAAREKEKEGEAISPEPTE